MRNPDPTYRRYTSLAWAAMLGHEDTFEFLLSEGHDDREVSRVSVAANICLASDMSPFTDRTLSETLFSSCLQRQNHPL